MTRITRIGLLDVAHEAGVSAKTVSRVLNGERGVSDAKRKQIQEIIERLGFQPNLAAQALKSKSSRTIMILATNFESFYVSEMIKGALRGVHECNANLVIEEYDGHDEERLTHIRRGLVQSPIRGAILPPLVCDDPGLLSMLADQDIPLVRISPTAGDPRAHLISCHEEAGASEVARHFHALGHRRIAVVLGPKNHSAAARRASGFLSAWLEAGGKAGDVRFIDFEEVAGASAATLQTADNFPLTMVDIGAAAAEQVISTGSPTAIFAFNDTLAAGLMWGANRLGLSVPRDISIAGFDGNIAASLVSPKLTTVVQPIRAMAEEAVRLLSTKAVMQVSLRLDVQFQPRESTGPAH